MTKIYISTCMERTSLYLGVSEQTPVWEILSTEV